MRSSRLRLLRIAVLLALFLVSFSLYFAAESGVQGVEIALLGALALLMLAAVWAG